MSGKSKRKPKRGPERVRRGSVESQECLQESLKGVQRESGESPERVKRGFKESQERVQRVKKGSRESQESVS